MTLRLIHSPDPDRDLPDPGDEVEAEPTCRKCGEPVEDERSKWCLDCYYGPDEDSDDDHRVPDDASEP